MLVVSSLLPGRLLLLPLVLQLLGPFVQLLRGLPQVQLCCLHDVLPMVTRVSSGNAYAAATRPWAQHAELLESSIGICDAALEKSREVDNSVPMRFYRQWSARCRHISLSGSAAFVDRGCRVASQRVPFTLPADATWRSSMASLGPLMWTGGVVGPLSREAWLLRLLPFLPWRSNVTIHITTSTFATLLCERATCSVRIAWHLLRPVCNGEVQTGFGFSLAQRYHGR